MTTGENIARTEPESAGMPKPIKLGVIGFIGLAIAGGLYLIAVRGEALLLDLGKLAAMCF